MIKKFFFCVYIFKIFYLGFIVNAYAYLDPGTGNILIQILAAVAATIAIYIGFVWYKIKLIFVKIKEKITKKRDENKNK